eukprot:jgi/Psemu1/50151/gm1.50151_g
MTSSTSELLQLLLPSEQRSNRTEGCYETKTDRCFLSRSSSSSSSSSSLWAEL